MNLEMLLARAQEIEAAIVNVSNQLQMLFGHKTEMQHWINQMQANPVETKVDEPIVQNEQMPVE